MALQATNPTKTKARSKLQSHFLELKDSHLKELFKTNPKRADELTVIWDDFYVDFSKNRITKIALEKTKCKDLSNLFTGATAVAFSNDAIISARILSKFAKTNENLKLLGGIMGNDVLDQAGVQNVANLPTLDEARANIVGILATPASKFVSILLARSEKMSSLTPENS